MNRTRRAPSGYTLSIGVVAILSTAIVHCRDPRPARAPVTAKAEPVPIKAFDGALAKPDELLAQSDPLGFLMACRSHYLATVSDYQGRFVKQELIRGRLTPVQETTIQFREQPFSVDMKWTKNAGRAERISYVEGRWVDDGRAMALIEPSGWLGALAPAGVRRDIHGQDATAESRRTIDQFGLKNTLDLMIRYAQKATGNADYELIYSGPSSFEGRPCYAFRRKLPYTGETGGYPDRILVVQIDQQWLVPVSVAAYADDQQTELLGRYEFRDLRFNTGLTDADF